MTRRAVVARDIEGLGGGDEMAVAQLRRVLLHVVFDAVAIQALVLWNLKYGTNEPIDRTETDSQTWRTDL